MHRETPQRRVLFARSLKPFGTGEFVAFCFLILVLVFTVVGSAGKAYAVANPTINFQARLMNIDGSIVQNATYNVEFKIYSVSSGGTALWTEDWLNSSSQGITVTDGYLTADLGSINSFANASIPWGSSLWLSINIGGTGSSPVWDGEMNPRLAVQSVPAALSLVSSNGTTGSVSTLGFVQPTASQSLLLPVGPNTTNYVCYQSDPNCGFALGTSASYIDNQTSLQSNANFYIQARSSTVAGTLEANGADILDLQNSSAANVVAFGNTGVITIAGGQTVDITTANSGSASANGITIAPGTSGGAASTGGPVTIRGGIGAGTASGGLLTLQGGTGGTGAAALGGNVQVQGGSAAGTGASNGGSIILQGGSGSGTGVEGQIQINGGLLYATTTFSSGTSATITQSAVDSYTTILATASASGLTFTVPAPTISSAGRMIVISNAGGTNAFIVAGAGNSFTLNTGSSATLMWNGTAWTNAGVDASTLQTAYNNSIGGATPLIQLNTTLNAVSIEANSGQASNQNFLTLLSPSGVSEIGFGVNGTYFQKPKVDGLDFEIQQNNGGTISSAKDVFSVDTTSTASVVNLGSTAAAGYNGSTVNIVTTNNANGTVNIGSSSLAGSATQNINIGYTSTSTGTTNVNIGSASPGGGTTTVRGAGGLTLTGGAASTWSTTAGALTLQGFAGVNLQTPGTAATSTNSTAVIIQTGNATGTTSNSGSITIEVGTATGTVGSINIGNTGTIANTINIAASGSAGVTQTVSIGSAGSGNSIVTLGSQTGTGYTTIQAGSTTNGPLGGGINLIVNGPSGGGGGGVVLRTINNNLYDALVIQNALGQQTLAFSTVAGEMTLGNMSTTAGNQLQGILTLADGNGGADGNAINLETASLSGLGTNTSATQLLPAVNGNVVVAQSGTAAVESGSINISGTATAGTAVQTPSLSSAASVALSITGNAASTWQTTAGALTIQSGTGNIILNPAGGSTTGSVQIGAGNGGAGSTTPDLLVLDDDSSSTTVPSVVNGAMYYNVAMKTFRCGENGAWISCIGGLRFANTDQNSLPASDTVSNSVAETIFGETYTIPANDCVQGRVYRITANGTFADASSTPTLAVRFKLGSTNIAAATATAASSSANTFTWTAQVDMTCVSALGTTAQIEGDGLFQSSATGGAWFFEPLANQSAAVDTTSNEVVHVSAQWGTAATTDTITLRQLVVEAMGP